MDDDFFDDFDDDDDAFFAASVAPPERAQNDTQPLGAFDGVVRSNRSSSPHQREKMTAESSSSSSSFGMLLLSYDDVASQTSSSARRRGRALPTLGQSTSGDALNGLNRNDDDDDLTDDAELLDLDRRHLSHLRDPISHYRIVARSVLALHQLACAADSIPSSSRGKAVQIESVTVFNTRRHRRIVRCVLPSLTMCLTTHTSPKCRSIAAQALAGMARMYYAASRFNPRLTCTRVPASISTLTEDECGIGCARSLVTAAIEDDDDGVSSAALESLGRLTMDAKFDNFAAEVRGIAECANPTNVLMYGGDDPIKLCWTVGPSTAIREMQTKAWENVAFPKMQLVLHRLLLYSNPHHVARSVPVVTAVLVHALTRGRDTVPSRRALQTNKMSHGKRGWREADAEGVAGEFVQRLLIPRTVNAVKNYDCSDGLSLALALVRMSSVCPHAQWRTSACRHATVVLLGILNNGMTSSLAPSAAIASWSIDMSRKRSSSEIISSTLSSALVPIEMLEGTAAMLVVALRGTPHRERAPGLSAVLHATLMYLPLGVPVYQGGGESPDLPISTLWEAKAIKSHFRLGRIGLLTEVALSLMLDGVTTCTNSSATLLRRVLQSDNLVSVWDLPMYERESTFQPANEVLWVFCSVATRLGKSGVIDVTNWCNLSLVLLDFFARLVCDPSRRSGSPFADAGHAAYCSLFMDVLQRCGSCPPPRLSIFKKMMPASFHESDIADKTSPVVGGPGKQLDHVPSSLTKVTTKILFLRDRDKGKVTALGGVDSVGDSLGITRLAAIIIDAWVGRCIMNHEARRSNEELLDMGILFFPFLSMILNQILHQHGDCSHQDSVAMVSQLSQVLIACFENIACISDVRMPARFMRKRILAYQKGWFLSQNPCWGQSCLLLKKGSPPQR